MVPQVGSKSAFGEDDRGIKKRLMLMSRFLGLRNVEFFLCSMTANHHAEETEGRSLFHESEGLVERRIGDLLSFAGLGPK